MKGMFSTWAVVASFMSLLAHPVVAQPSCIGEGCGGIFEPPPEENHDDEGGGSSNGDPSGGLIEIAEILDGSVSPGVPGIEVSGVGQEVAGSIDIPAPGLALDGVPDGSAYSDVFQQTPNGVNQASSYVPSSVTVGWPDLSVVVPSDAVNIDIPFVN